MSNLNTIINNINEKDKYLFKSLFEEKLIDSLINRDLDKKGLNSLKKAFELNENDELCLKIIYSLENVYIEHLKTILSFIYTSEKGVVKMLNKLEENKWIYSVEKELGKFYALTKKGIQIFEPYNIAISRDNITDQNLFLHYVKGAVLSQKINILAFNKLVKSFVEENINVIELYIYFQYIKNIIYIDFLNKTDEEKTKELIYLGFNQKEINDFLESVYTNTIIKSNLKEFQKKYKSKYNEASKDERYIKFKEEFLNTLSQEEINMEQVNNGLMLLEDYKKNLFSKNYDIDIKKFFINSKNNYLRFNTYKTRYEIKKALIKIKTLSSPIIDNFDITNHSKLIFNKNKVKPFIELEDELAQLRKDITRLSGYERRYYKDIKELEKKDDTEALNNKIKDYKELKDYIDAIQQKIEVFEEYVFVNIEEKKDEMVNKPMTFDILKDNAIFIDDVKVINNNVEIDIGIIDNLKSGIKHLFFLKEYS